MTQPSSGCPFTPAPPTHRSDDDPSCGVPGCRLRLGTPARGGVHLPRKDLRFRGLRLSSEASPRSAPSTACLSTACWAPPPTGPLRSDSRRQVPRRLVHSAAPVPGRASGCVRPFVLFIVNEGETDLSAGPRRLEVSDRSKPDDLTLCTIPPPSDCRFAEEETRVTFVYSARVWARASALTMPSLASCCRRCRPTVGQARS